MSAPASAFQKLPGRGLGWTGRGCLWLAGDYVLEATSAVVMERYRRFFFGEIRAIIVRRTRVRLICGLVQGGIGIATGLLAGALVWVGAIKVPVDARIALYILAGMVGAVTLFSFTLLLINLLLGPSCRCHLLTPTGWQALTAPTRLGPARRALARIAPLVEAAQATSAASTEEETARLS